MRPTAVILFASVLAVGQSLIWAQAPQAPQGAQGRGGQAQQPPPPPPTPRAAAPIDLTGYWVSIVNEDWRWRMVTPAKGDYESVPYTDEAKRIADSWDLARDEASGNACKPFGVGNIMRMPGRLHITWQDDRTLKLEFDAGTQTRLLHFDGTRPEGSERTWQGYSVASWDRPSLPPRDRTAGNNANRLRENGLIGGEAPPGGSLAVATTMMRPGYLRKNGLPYSENAVVSEYFDRITYPNGDTWLIVRTSVDDPQYLQVPFITSTNFKRERDGSKWHPTPCKIDPPSPPGR
jgi:hypothetical protein